MTLANLSLWLCTYMVHSSALLLLCMLIDRLGLLKQLRLAQWAWRFALLTGLLSASFQYGQLIEPAISEKTPPSEQTRVSRTLNYSNQTFRDAASPQFPAVHETVQTTFAHSNHSLAETSPTNSALLNHIWQTPQIHLPDHFARWLAWLAAIWLVYATYQCVVIVLQISALNRQVKGMPSAASFADDRHLQNVIRELGLHTSQVRLADGWSSPFLTPNKLICIPIQAVNALNQSQLHAIVAHEYWHLQRNDQIWRIVTHLMSKIFCFQMLNQVATRKLNLLAEFDCDHYASQSNRETTEFSETLLWCIENSNNTKLPQLAVAMAAPSALSQRITLLLDETAMNALFQKQSNLRTLSLLFTALLGAICLLITLPRFAHAVPALTGQSDSQTNLYPLKETSTRETPPSHRAQQSNLSIESHQSPEPSASAHVERSAVEANRPSDFPVNKPEEKTKPNNYTEAELERASVPDNSHQNREIASATTLSGDLTSLIQRARGGNIEAQVELGERYWYGEGITVDQIAARLWFEKAAAQGNPRSLAFLKMMQERLNRQAEIEFYTKHYDGQDLAWEEDRCPLPKINHTDPKQNDYPLLFRAIDKSVICRNEYLAVLKRKLEDDSTIPSSLKDIMTSTELQQARSRIYKVLLRNAYASREKATNAIEEIREWERKFISPATLSYTSPRLTGYFREPEQRGYQPDVIIQPTFSGSGQTIPQGGSPTNSTQVGHSNSGQTTSQR